MFITGIISSTGPTDANGVGTGGPFAEGSGIGEISAAAINDQTYVYWDHARIGKISGVSSYGNVPNITMGGNVFIGWQTQDSGSGNNRYIDINYYHGYLPLNKLVLNGLWQPSSITITADDGSLTMTYTQGQTIDPSPFAGKVIKTSSVNIRTEGSISGQLQSVDGSTITWG